MILYIEEFYKIILGCFLLLIIFAFIMFEEGVFVYMKLYTIGASRKSAVDFFQTLKQHGIKRVIDVRLNNSSQLSGFTKGPDLKFFLREICNIDYEHDNNLSPPQDIMVKYKNKDITWNEYRDMFAKMLADRQIAKIFSDKVEGDFSNICFLCSESRPNYCHRKIVAEYIQQQNPEMDIEVVHL